MAQAIGAGTLAAHATEVYLWPCNVQAWQCWRELQTQWRTGVGGATGLDYAAVLAYLRDVAGLRGDERRQVFECLRAAEAETLDEWAARRERDAQRQRQG